MNICKKNIAVLCINAISLIIINFFLNEVCRYNFVLWNKVFAIICLLSIIKDFISLKIVDGKIFSIIGYFIILSYIFSFGHVFINAIFDSYEFISDDFLHCYGQSLTKYGLIFSYNIIEIVNLSIYLFAKKTKKDLLKKYRMENFTKKEVKKIAWCVFIPTVTMRLIYVLDYIKYVRVSTYNTSSLDSYSGIFIQLSYFCLIGFVLILLAYSYNKVYSRIIFIFELIFSLFSMLSGSRIFAVISICILIYIYYTCVERINIKIVLQACLFLLIFLPIVTSITILRTSDNFTFTKIIQYAFSKENNFVFKILDEFGGTIYTTFVTIAEVPQKIDFNCGLSYIESWLLVGLNINGILDNINDSVEYTTLLHSYSYGGTYIGELYYNFGKLSYFFAPFIGFIVSKISSLCSKFILDKEYIKLSFLIMPIYSLLCWVRGYFSSFCRGSVWAYVMICAVCWLIRKQGRIKNYK